MPGDFLGGTAPSPDDSKEGSQLALPRRGALSEGGQVQMPMEKTFWSPAFGMVADRFGVSWMVNVMQ